MSWEGNTTLDDFLGGRLKILQPSKGYRAATDPVFLAAATPAQPGESVLELGCGVAVASLCLARRVKGLRMTAIELQEAYLKLARNNAAHNKVALNLFCANLENLPAELKQTSFDHVIFNPPFVANGAATEPDNFGKAIAHHQNLPMKVWIDTALRRLNSGGYLTLIQHAHCLPEILGILGHRVGATQIKPVTSRAGHAAKRVIICTRKGRRSPATLCAPLIVHKGRRHEADQNSFTKEAQGILRDATTLEY